MLKSVFNNILAALPIYILLLFRLGYEFGGGDQIEVLPYVMYLKNNALFQQDLYIQSAAAAFPNERWFIIQLIKIAPESLLYAWVMLLHIVFSLLLITGLLQCASLFVNNKLMQWLVVAANLVILYLYAPGGNELYYNTLIASLAAKGIAAWAVYYFFSKRFFVSVLLLIPVTWLHALVGLHLAALFFSVYILTNIKEVKKHIATILKSLSVYLLLAVSFVLYIKHNTDSVQQYSQLSNTDFYQILFDFRNPHHYNPLHFSLKAYLLFSLLMPVALFSFRKNKMALYFVAFAILLFVVGSINALYFKSIAIASLQFFKVTIWLKFLGVVAIFKLSQAFAEKYFAKFLQYRFGFKQLLLLNLLFISVYFISEKVLFQNNIFKHSTYSSETDISLKAKSNSAINSVFIYPIHFTQFPFYSERSSYINFKAIAREKNYIKQWAERISTVYNVSTNQKVKGFDVQQVANDNFSKINFEKTQLLKEKGITHIITFKTHEIENLEIIAENKDYKIYKL